MANRTYAGYIIPAGKRSSERAYAGYVSGQAYEPVAVVTSQTIEPTGIASAEAFGSPAIQGPVIPIGIASAEAFGQPVVTVNLLIVPIGIASAETFGEPSIGGGILPVGIASAEAIGQPTILTGQIIDLDGAGIASAEAFGSALIQGAIVPIGIASAEALGSPVVTRSGGVIVPIGIASAEAFGTPAITHTNLIAGIVRLRMSVIGANPQMTNYIAGTVRLNLRLNNSYVGPGTGIVVIGEQDPYGDLREGDWFPLIEPWAGLYGLSGVGRVLKRSASDDQNRQTLELQFIPQPDPGLSSGPEPTTGERYTAPVKSDTARRVENDRRTIDRLIRTRRGG